VCSFLPRPVILSLSKVDAKAARLGCQAHHDTVHYNTIGDVWHSEGMCNEGLIAHQITTSREPVMEENKKGNKSQKFYSCTSIVFEINICSKLLKFINPNRINPVFACNVKVLMKDLIKGKMIANEFL
jgi:hypothetical protein